MKIIKLGKRLKKTVNIQGMKRPNKIIQKKILQFTDDTNIVHLEWQACVYHFSPVSNFV